jgi:phage N-6-adenine-methyltransferase
VTGRNIDVHYSSASAEWSTPQDLFDELDREFDFELDVCATAENAKCPRYFDKKIDGLRQNWNATSFMNPPYGDVIGDWVAKVHYWGDRGYTIVCLLPARPDNRWWWDHARHGEIRFLKGRLRFGGATSSEPFPSAVVIFGRPASVVWWDRGTKTPRDQMSLWR